MLGPNLAIVTFINFTATVRTFVLKQPVSLPPLSFTPNLTIVSHFTMFYQINGLQYTHNSLVLSRHTTEQVAQVFVTNQLD